MKQRWAYIVCLLLRLAPVPRQRAWLLRKLGSRIGTNCRIHAVEFLNPESGFSSLEIGDDCYIGPGVMIDLGGEVHILEGAVLSARVMVLSHDDPGSSHGSPLCRHYPAGTSLTCIGRYCWLGAGSIVLTGTSIGDQCVLAAGSVARGSLAPHSLYAGSPAVLKRQLRSADE